ncbi:MAG: ribosomal protein S18-alanine N-acetyltransferase [Oscillospiraceae bacterium]|nr:ribosomal protein S18-alanine N-acetyltransferase [Oscillospiraceae bacterium]
MSGIAFARMDLTHLLSAVELEKECFSLPWSAEMFLAELNDPHCVYFAAEEDGRLIGYAGMQYVLDEGYINNIAVSPSYRRRGVASALMDRLIDSARGLSLAFLTLEVRCGNHAAISLYEKYGFERVGLRRGYYEKPREDALLMTLFFGRDASDREEA